MTQEAANECSRFERRADQHHDAIIGVAESSPNEPDVAREKGGLLALMEVPNDLFLVLPLGRPIS
jgi:hypothetical protein